MSKTNPDQYDVESGDINGSKKLSAAVVTVTARVVTTVSLIVSVAVIYTNNTTIYSGRAYTYKRVFSYKYMVCVALFGLAANAVCIIHYVLWKKNLVTSYRLLKFCFYVDKIAAVLLATGGGAAFCATVDLKRVKWDTNNSKKQEFLSVGYVAAAFLLVGCIATVASSVHSSLALTKIT